MLRWNLPWLNGELYYGLAPTLLLMPPKPKLAVLQQQIVDCDRCPRLREHCRRVAETKRRAYRDWDYWSRPVPSFGDPRGRVLIIGLAPAAHGANRTGRMFTGDSSGDFLYETLHRTGFASQAEATRRGDGLKLHDCYITAAARCAPPDNKPSREEFAACRPYLAQEMQLLDKVRVVVVLGRLALDSYLTILLEKGAIDRRSAYPFAHGALHRLPLPMPLLLCSYHPSRQNTNTGRLTRAMLLRIFRKARQQLVSVD